MSPSAFITALFPSMFHRRLLLLLALMVLAALPLLFRLTTLTVAQADELRADAEKRLVRRQWTSTVRGSVLDRKGRVLAQDRPSYDVAVSYPVITGHWVTEQSRRAARRAAGVGWADMDKDEREELTARYRSAYLLHMERGWDELARTLGITRQELDTRRDKVVTEVTSKQRHNTQVLIRRDLAQRLKVQPADLLARWKKLEPTIDPNADGATLRLTTAVARSFGDAAKDLDDQAIRSIVKHAEQPIAETTQMHVLAFRVSDDVGFLCRRLAWDEVELDPSRSADTVGTPSAPPSPAANPDITSYVERMPGLAVIDGGDRYYPIESANVPIDTSTLPGPLRADGTKTITVEGVATHILGRIRNRVQKEDIERRSALLAANDQLRTAAIIDGGIDRGAYRDGDRVGDTGIEASQEGTLRGLRGLHTTRVDTAEQLTLDPIKGKDVTLTIDVMLQARVQAAMSPELGLSVASPWHYPKDKLPPPGAPQFGTTLDGAAVVLDIDSGDLLAMVSMPSYTRQQARDNPDEVYDDPLRVAWLNRAIAKPYQPGSIVKPLIMLGAAQRAHYHPGESIACVGHFFPNQPNMFRCWIYKQFHITHNDKLGHDLSGADATMVSCNIFFFTLGRRLGPQGIQDVYRDFGIGRRFDLGLGQEFVGSMGLNGNPETLKAWDATQMGIGQGPIAWTPVHAAASYATIARNGVVCNPRLIMGQPAAPERELNLNSRVIEEAMQGLWGSVNSDQGTGHHLSLPDGQEPIFNAKGVKVWGKTGTAAAAPVIGDPDGETGPEGAQVLAAGDHSWFVVMVGRDRPKYVISVVTDFGGSGGKVSGPICNQIIHALIAEGYL
ncbi:MAG TPA: penicillin-binding transpeptidase domain-containing protein [Phycisphaerales bacterium]|nr:penicillin-binding transpeptidase domain-containing protein [Phycisphaerales bacterium]